MNSLLLTVPTVEPLSLDEAKAFLRVEHSDDDEVIAVLIAAARIHVESQIRRALIAQRWRLSADCWPENGRLHVVPGPLQQLDAVRVFDFEGLAHDVDIQTFVPDKGASLLAFAPRAVPAPGRIVAGIELDVTVGYGDSALAVPEPLRQAMRLLLGHWYDHRGLVAAGQQVAELPLSVATLIAPYRMLSL